MCYCHFQLDITCLLSRLCCQCMKLKFKLDSSIPPLHDASPVPSASFSSYQLQLDLPADTSTPVSDPGPYAQDLAKEKYNMAWDSLGDMQAWLRKEQDSKIIELGLKWRRKNKGNNPTWSEKHYYVCARQGTGGLKKYEKKHPEWGRKFPGKRTGCICHLVIKIYSGTTKILGKYLADHSHPIGKENACYTKLSRDTRVQIAEMLRMGISHEHIVRDLPQMWN